MKSTLLSRALLCMLWVQLAVPNLNAYAQPPARDYIPTTILEAYPNYEPMTYEEFSDRIARSMETSARALLGRRIIVPAKHTIPVWNQNRIGLTAFGGCESILCNRMARLDSLEASPWRSFRDSVSGFFPHMIFENDKDFEDFKRNMENNCSMSYPCNVIVRGTVDFERIPHRIGLMGSRTVDVPLIRVEEVRLFQRNRNAFVEGLSTGFVSGLTLGLEVFRLGR